MHSGSCQCLSQLSCTEPHLAVECVHTYTYAYTHTQHTHMHIHTCTHAHTHAHTHTHTCKQTHAHTCTHVCMHTPTHTHTCTHIHTHTNTHMHTHMHMHTHGCAHTSLATYIHTLSWVPAPNTNVCSSISFTGGSTVVQVAVSFDKLAANGLELQYPYGFEIGCATVNGTMSQWIEGTAVKADDSSVMIEFLNCPSMEKATMIRYCWRTDPCSFKKCPIYSGNLPSPPFIMNLD